MTNHTYKNQNHTHCKGKARQGKARQEIIGRSKNNVRDMPIMVNSEVSHKKHTPHTSKGF
jgi:hypothetical protein